MARRPTCPTTGKLQFKRASAAMKVVGWVRRSRHGLDDHPRSVYRCEHCNRWHLTSMPPAESRRINHVKKVRSHDTK